MSLVRVNGVNPFSGQKDPYITMDSSVSYDDGPQGTIENSYKLNGVLTGCSVNELSTRRDALVKSFDWKADTGIINNIQIIGVVTATQDAQIIPTSLSFESSNYIGALSYSLDLQVFTGFGDRDDDNELVNKTHTESTSINEDGCITINTTIGAEPNSNLSHCKAVETAKPRPAGSGKSGGGAAKGGDEPLFQDKDMPDIDMLDGDEDVLGFGGDAPLAGDEALVVEEVAAPAVELAPEILAP